MTPRTSQQIFSDMRIRILEVLTEDWSKYLLTVTSAYDAAYTNVKTKLGKVQAAIIERQKAQQALMVGVLSVLTGGVVGVFADKLAKQLPAVASLEKATLTEVTKVAEKDSVLSEILSDTLKDGIKKGGEKFTELGLDHFKGEGQSEGFQPNGVSVAKYQKLLNDGITDRAKVLSHFARILENMADSFPAELADSISQGLEKNDFFDEAKRNHIKDEDLLEKKAELALWCGWALARDEDYWTKQVAMAPYRSEVVDFNPVRERIIDLGVPEEAVTVSPYPVAWRPAQKLIGLDVIGFMKWVKSSDMVHALYEGISTAGGETHHWGRTKMQEAVRLSITAA